MTRSFVHLHLHTHYSLLDALPTPAEVVEAARRYRCPAVAVTDHGNVFGAIEFYEAATRAGVKPILGMEAYVAPGSRHEKVPRGGAERGHHLLLLAADDRGYRNLVKLASIGFTEGFYYNPRIDKEVLAAHAEGLIGTTACLSGEVAEALLAGRREAAERAVAEYVEIFGRGRFYVEVQDHGIAAQRRILPALREISDRLHVSRVATADVHYIAPEDARPHDVLLCVGVRKAVTDADRKRYDGEDFYFRSPEEMRRLFEDDPAAVDATLEIAEAVRPPDLAFGALHLPRFPLPDGETDENEFLGRLARESLRRRFGGDPPAEYAARLDLELDVIRRLGFAGYFLIVADFIRAAREKGIAVGPGRGSAAGSLVAYAVGITEVDPMPYGLLFERFLTLERRELPDIDVDFERARRDEVIAYLRERYGHDRTAQIVTFGTLGAKAVIRDVARALGVPYGEADRLAKMIPVGASLAEAIEGVPEVALEARGAHRDLFETALRLEGRARHASRHAAGVVVADRPLTEIVPLYVDADGNVTTQYDMNAIARLGLLKIDVLGLVTLDVIEAARRHLRAACIEIDWDSIPLDDPPTYELLRTGRTLGVFQLDSAGIRDFVRRVGPTTFEDLAAILALYRPGPMNLLDEFIGRKNGTVPVTYLHPALEPILGATYGIITYQEQVMRIAHEIAGFTLAEADHLRKAMGKKIPEIMRQNREKFVAGAVARGVGRATAQSIYDLLERFAAYGFNRSHAVAYAILAFRTAYLKAHHPAAFMAALLSSEISNREKLAVYIAEARRMGLRVLPPDVRESGLLFTPVGEKEIRFGLLGIKGVGEAAVEAILAARAERPFRDLVDFCARLDPGVVNRKAIEALIQVGAFDWTGAPRRACVAGLDAILGAAAAAARDRAAGQASLFGDCASVAVPLPDVGEYDEERLLALEKDLAGLYISGHPLERHADAIRAAADTSTREVGARAGRRVRVAGLVTAVDRRLDRRGEEWARVRLEDLEGECEVLVFASAWREAKGHVAPGRVVVVEGRAERGAEGGEGAGRVLANRAAPLGAEPEGALVLVMAADANAAILKEVRARIERAPRGPTPVVLRLPSRGGTTTVRVPRALHVAPTDDLVADLRAMPGVADVALARPAPPAPAADDAPF